MQSKYTHDLEIHKLQDAHEIVPELVKVFQPSSVADFGCGIGTFLAVFKENGVSNVLGIDGTWTDKIKLFKNIEEDDYLEHDLEKHISLDRVFDLVICLEVAEHLSESCADILVRNLVDAGKTIVFSAAIPGQGGQNHLNEQRLSYWKSKFSKHNYNLHDFLRPKFWSNDSVFWWYRQNIVVFAHNNVKFPNQEYSPIVDMVHYELYDKTILKNELLKQKVILFESGGHSPRKYLKLLVKSLFKVFN